MAENRYTRKSFLKICVYIISGVITISALRYIVGGNIKLILGAVILIALAVLLTVGVLKDKAEYIFTFLIDYTAFLLLSIIGFFMGITNFCIITFGISVATDVTIVYVVYLYYKEMIEDGKEKQICKNVANGVTVTV